MPRYLTKTSLLDAIRDTRAQLEKKYSKLTPEQMIWPGSMDNWSVKDILAHLVDWEQRLIGWYQAGLRGAVPETPGPGMSWRDIPTLNQRGYEKHQDDPLDLVMENFQRSYQETLRLVEGMSEEEIYSPGYYKWTGKSSLYSYIAANTFRHYNWARTQIRTTKITKAFKNQSEQ
ncbi:MAG: hypothetical protein AMJ88_06870 [Anaerolineae bacterium SM23_ 63]|nr:MAG: hypothetical protein AMJ88_06870 [Anaerolineae bacterium SM23_ 63]HEY46856.1 ClbS/DfsB family four-helix bundle protein [Anaerolineae bacterium]